MSDADHILGFDVNQFTSRVVYAVFNDPDGADIRDLPEAIRPQLTDVPLLEDESLRRVLDHAKLMNEDRAELTPRRSPVVVRSQTVLTTPWVDVPLDGA